MNRTIISDTFAPFGTLPVLPDKPEPTPEERAAAKRARQAATSDVLREYFAAGCTLEDVNFAIAAHQFPKPIGMRAKRFGFTQEPVYDRQQLDTWRERFMTFAAKVR